MTFLFQRGTEKKTENQSLLPPCFKVVVFRKISLRGLQCYIFSLVYPYMVLEE